MEQNKQDPILKNVCRQYMAGNCTRTNCKFIHNPNLCIHFYNESCKHGDKCKYSHDPVSNFNDDKQIPNKNLNVLLGLVLSAVTRVK